MANDITKLEIDAGIIARDPKRLKDIKTATDLQQDFEANGSEYVGCNYEARAEFLEANGYEITRENLIDGNLSVRPPETDE